MTPMPEPANEPPSDSRRRRFDIDAGIAYILIVLVLLAVFSITMINLPD